MPSLFRPWSYPFLGRRRFLWQSNFDQAAAAGAVNGMRMRPGLGTLTAIDTESKITVANGGLTIASGKAAPAYGDPGAWVDTPIIRVVGRLVAFKFSITDVTAAIEIGLDTGKTGELAGHRIRITGDTLVCYDGVTAGPVVAIPTDGTECVVLFALRAAGCKIYLKCGTGYFEFLWATGTLTTATLYAGISNYSATAFVDFIRGITYRWLSKPLGSDGFGGAAGTMDGRLSDGAGHAETSGTGSGGVLAWAGANGSVDGNGNLVITPTLGEELLTDGGFEDWTSDTNLTSWSETLGGTSTINKESSVVQEGSFACRMDIDATNGAALLLQANVTAIGSWYLRKSYAKGTVAGKTFDFLDATATVRAYPVTTGYALYLCTYRAASTSIGVKRGTAASSSLYLDANGIRQITFSTCYLSRAFSTKDVFIETNFTLIAGLQAGVIFGLNETGTSFGLARLDGTNFILEICEAGTWAAAKATVANTSVTNVNLKIFVRGSAIWCYVGDVLMGSGPTTTLSEGETANLAGLKISPFSTSELNTFHSFVVEAIGKNNEHGIIDRYVGA